MLVAKNYIKTDATKSTMKTQISLLKKHVNIITFPNLYKLVHLAISIPISLVLCERSFSSMKRINTYTRSTVIQNMFSSLAILNIERDISNTINSQDIPEIHTEQDIRLVL